MVGIYQQKTFIDQRLRAQSPQGTIRNNNHHQQQQQQQQQQHQQQQHQQPHHQHMKQYRHLNSQTPPLLPQLSSSASLLKKTLPTHTTHNLIDSLDDVEHNIPATFIQDPNNISKCELASPRCHSRDSSVGGRCPSDDSNYSGRNSAVPPSSNRSSNSPPLGITLPATLPPGAAASLLPPQSAAMAAYLGAAAVAAQQNRLLGLGNHHSLAALAGGVGGGGSGGGGHSSPPSIPLSSPLDSESSVLDFSTKRKSEYDDNNSPPHKSDLIGDMNDGLSGGGMGDGSGIDAVNLSNKSDNVAPLDLTINRKRYINTSPPPQSRNKMSRSDYKQSIVSPWTTPMTPYFAAAVAAANSSLSPKNQPISDWNNKQQKLVAQNDATKALEKMSELSRIGGNDVGRQSSTNSNSGSSSGVGGGGGNSGGGGSSGGSSSTTTTGRHSAWQSHWLNKGADSVKDVFKCVWCKLSFPTLESLTTHMKETQHMGTHVPHSTNNNSTGGGSNQSQSQHQSHHQQQHQQQHHNQQQQQQQQQQHHHHQSQTSASQAAANAAQAKADLNLLIKETMPLPRKLVRGQDVWLGKGAEQTRQILKCMWCGQSFRSLSEMTTHMQQTQHYTNIISQEQIISWKSSDDTKGSGNSGSNSGSGNGNNSGSGNSGGGGGSGGGNSGSQNQSGGNSGANSTVSAVLTCKVCDQAFSSLKDLSNHMVKNAHYKEHIMRSISESGGRRRQTREKRKKSLPVRKLLELERAQHDFKNGDSNIQQLNKTMRDVGRITCDKCGDKIDAVLFVDHIRQCVSNEMMAAHRDRGSIMKSLSNSIISPDSLSPMITSTPTSRDGRKSIGGGDDHSTTSPNSRHHISPNAMSPITSKDLSSGGGGGGGSMEKNSSPSVLNALEQLIEKSFDTRTRHGGGGGGGSNNNSYAQNNQQSAPLGASILKRLGIDESVDYTKPLIDPQTMNFLRNYSQQSQAASSAAAAAASAVHQFDRRERSGSESSSVSDRGSSRMNSLTPERKIDHMSSNHCTPIATPDKMMNHDSGGGIEHHHDQHVSIKKEPMDDDHDLPHKSNCDVPLNVSIKKESAGCGGGDDGIDDDDDRPKSIKQELIDGGAENLVKRRPSTISSPAPSPRQSTPGAHHTTPLASPCSDRSITPRSTPGPTHNMGVSSDKKSSVATSSSSSLGALSSMFDSLTGAASNTNTSDPPSQTKKGSSHPLAALQKLCDKTENTTTSGRSNTSGNQSLAAPAIATGGGNTGGSTGGTNTNSGSTASGAILAFSWACNDAVMTSDSIIKCKLCDTPFCSKGAYRHHLSKVHFVNDEAVLESSATMRSSVDSSTSSSGSSQSGGSGNSGNNNNKHQNQSNQKHHNNQHHQHSQPPQSPKNNNGGGGGGNSISNNGTTQNTKTPPPSSSSSTSAATTSTSTSSPSTSSTSLTTSATSASTLPPGSAFEESPHSKFLKYTELAKQLSSKYV